MEEFNKINFHEIKNPTLTNREFSVIFDLWIDNERSDLTLECDVEYYGTQDIRVYLYDLHVL
jgi:hypothetical protein